MKDKDVRLVVITGLKLKEEFRAACDGRNMSHEVIKLMKQYIKDSKIKNNKSEE
jgi:hypothetical protein